MHDFFLRKILWVWLKLHTHINNRNMIKKLLLPVVMLFGISGVFSQAKLVEKVVKKARLNDAVGQGNEIVIPYEKYVLPNALLLLFMKIILIR